MKQNYFTLPGLVGLKTLRYKQVKDVITKTLKVSFDDLAGKSRLERLPDNRKMFIYCINKYCGANTSVALGKLINRDHATVLYYFKRCNDLRETDPAFKNVLDNLEYKIKQLNGKV